MTEFIWFYGASGVGKSSIINQIAEGQLKLPGVDRALVCRESLDFGRRERVDLLEKELGKYAVASESVLIKGQAVDLGPLWLPYRVHQNYPEVVQRVVFVYSKPELLAQRVSSRQDSYWPNPEHDFAKETQLQIDLVSKLCQELATQPLIIDNSQEEPQIKTSHDLAGLI